MRTSRPLISVARGLLCFMVCTGCWVTGPLLASEQCAPCEDGDASRVVRQVDCVTEEQLEKVLSYHNPVSDERLMRETLAVAFEIAACINDFRLFPEVQGNDFHCLQCRLVNFYEQISQPETQPGGLHFQDLLASASLRIHYCMIDEDLPVLSCLRLMENAFEDYQSVFRAAAQIQADPEGSGSMALADAMEISIKDPAPDFAQLESFVDLSLENSLRFPRVLGRQIGAAVGSALCDAYQLYPDRRAYIADHYNLLVRFDRGNMAASGQLHQFVEQLKEFFRATPGTSSFLQLRPADWSTSPHPCSAENWVLDFPEFVMLSGYRLPGTRKLELALTRLEVVLAQSAEFSEQRTHVWQPFHRYGNLLLGLGRSLKSASSRSQRMWETRHLLMEKARDAFLLRAVEPEKYPGDPRLLQGSIGQQIQTYGEELLSELRVDPLITFVEEYLEAGDVLLTELQKQQLHRLLAIGYTVQEDQYRALVHLQRSNLERAELERVQKQLREMGVGVRFQD